MIVCIVGYMASGKSTVANIFKTKGFKIVEMGDTVREEMKRRGIEINSESVRTFSAKLRKEQGNAAVAKLTLKKIKNTKGNIAITGMRSLHEYNYFKKKLKDIKIIAVSAPERMRFKRMLKRNKPDDPKTLSEFRKIEEKERRGFATSKSEEKYGIDKVIDNADFVIFNTSTQKALKEDVSNLIKTLKLENK